jgi:hypothetical protein
VSYHPSMAAWTAPSEQTVTLATVISRRR